MTLSTKTLIAEALRHLEMDQPLKALAAMESIDDDGLDQSVVYALDTAHSYARMTRTLNWTQTRWACDRAFDALKTASDKLAEGK